MRSLALVFVVVLGCRSEPAAVEAAPAPAVPAPAVTEAPPPVDPGIVATATAAYVARVQNDADAAQRLLGRDPAGAVPKYVAILEADAARREAERLPAGLRAAVRTELALALLLTGGRDRAWIELEGATKEANTLPSPQREAVLQVTKHLAGDFAGAAAAALSLQKRTTAPGTPADPETLATLAELAVLAGRTDAADVLHDARNATRSPEASAVLGTYSALLAARDGRRAEALATLDLALEAARVATDSTWQFQTLGKPFAGTTAWETCAAAWYESVRTATATTGTKTPLVAPTERLRTCLAAH